MIQDEIRKKRKQTILSEPRPTVSYLDDENPMCRSPELNVCVIVGDVLNITLIARYFNIPIMKSILSSS